jgi:hypothetical protein
MSEIRECNYVVIEKNRGETVTEIMSRYYSNPPPQMEVEGFKKIFKDGLRDFVLVKIYNVPQSDTSLLIYKKSYYSKNNRKG